MPVAGAPDFDPGRHGFFYTKAASVAEVGRASHFCLAGNGKMYFDPLYMLVMLVAMVIGGAASMAVKGAFAHYKKVRASSGVSGAEAAYRMLTAAGLQNTVRIERVSGYLSDHYDPRSNVVRLSTEVYDGRNLAALGVACHEVGHAIQHATKYAPLMLRNMAVPVAGFGSNISTILIIIGVGLMSMQALAFGQAVAVVGLLLFSAVVVFQLINLPVEFDASARAKAMLPKLGLIHGRAEASGVAMVLNAAALTYVAATVVAAMQLLYWAYVIFGSGRGRDANA